VLMQGGWQSGDGIVLDGVRHATILDALRQVAYPMPVRLLHIDTPTTIRDVRLDNRRRAVGANSSQRAEIDAHITEHDVVTALPTIADFTVDGQRDVGVIVQDVLRWLQCSGSRSRPRASD
jgi:hypothetical protein